jgi:glutathione S-transferase
LAVNPKAKVPALLLDEKDVITEAQAVLLFIADLFPMRAWRRLLRIWCAGRNSTKP